MKSYYIIVGIIVLVALSVSQCSWNRQINQDETYDAIKPVAPLPEYERSGLPVNVEVSIKNVADMNNSYKNTIDLYVNDYIINPDNVFNYKSNYTYQMRLQPGIYKIKAVYHANTGWQEKKFTISTQEPVKVYLDKKLELSLTLEKNWWGAPQEKHPKFNVEYASLE
ncbi:hypothetical protein JW960_07855 [candidate division KSB1 bacterium]|nr:hypothetical protein [candidate division KSB1 bacterium]